MEEPIIVIILVGHSSLDWWQAKMFALREAKT